MNKEIEEDDRVIKISMPLLTKEEMTKIDNNFNEIVNEIKNQFIKEKDLAIAQYIIDKQQKELEQKETILDKVTDKLKEDANQKIPLAEDMDWVRCRKEHAREILNIIEGEKK